MTRAEFMAVVLGGVGGYVLAQAVVIAGLLLYGWLVGTL